MPAPGEVHFLVLDPDRHPETFGLKEDAVMTSRYFAFALIVLLLAGAAVASAHDGEKLGTVHFPVSCAPAVQADFERAVALLHSFWYEEAVKAFTAVTAADATC